MPKLRYLRRRSGDVFPVTEDQFLRYMGGSYTDANGVTRNIIGARADDFVEVTSKEYREALKNRGAPLGNSSQSITTQDTTQDTNVD